MDLQSNRDVFHRAVFRTEPATELTLLEFNQILSSLMKAAQGQQPGPEERNQMLRQMVTGEYSWRLMDLD